MKITSDRTLIPTSTDIAKSALALLPPPALISEKERSHSHPHQHLHRKKRDCLRHAARTHSHPH
ncbi:hypothetical protein [Argonema antarcticum]|uniref:hypothetical protein n=1 Tax=Argonema antarcticum TaxID=2942763 RepID=UPI002013A3C6|nr:hypothetical protein [Argonema antarcticum]MCL1473786.1 hypothetical protein [Argonema antarcticum A004/B2]